MLQSVARVVLDDRGGALTEQITGAALLKPLFRFLHQPERCTQNQRRPSSLLVAICYFSTGLADSPLMDTTPSLRSHPAR